MTTATLERPTNLGGIPIGGIPPIPLDDLTHDQYLSMWGELCALRDYKAGVELLAIDGKAAPVPAQFFGTLTDESTARMRRSGNGGPPGISTGKPPSVRQRVFTWLSENGPATVAEIHAGTGLPKEGISNATSGGKGKQFASMPGNKWKAIGNG